MKTAWLLAAAMLVAACGPGGSDAPPPATTVPPATTPPTTTMAPACDPVPASCDVDKPPKPDTDAEFGTGCLVTVPKKDHCDPVKERQKFKWKFRNTCGSKVYDVKIVEPVSGRDLKNCSTIKELDKNGGEITCEVVERTECTGPRGLKYTITWATTSGGTPQTHDPILEVRKYP